MDIKKRILKGVQDCLNKGTCVECPYVNEENCQWKLMDDLRALLNTMPEFLTAREASRRATTASTDSIYSQALIDTFHKISAAASNGNNYIIIEVNDKVSARICHFLLLLQYDVVLNKGQEGLDWLKIKW